MSEGRKRSSFDAQKLRIVLSVSILLLVGLAAGVFIFFRSQLVSYAQQVQLDNANAQVSASDVNRLKTLKEELESNVVAVTRAKNIVAESKYYQYQNQIIADITSYGKKAGLQIAGFTFNNEVAGAAAGAAAGATQTIAPAGLKSTSVSVSIRNPVNYQAVAKFVNYIEVNLTKMQVLGIAITKAETNNGNVNANPITIEVYTR